MAIYRKRPVQVEAEQFFSDKPLPFRDRGPVVGFNGSCFYVTTIHGQETPIVSGDWIILEPGGECRAYPCKSHIFDATYEPV